MSQQPAKTNMFTTKAYALYRLGNRPHYLRSQRPMCYEVIDQEGNFKASFFQPAFIDGYLNKGFLVRKADLDAEISQLKKAISRVKRRKD